MIKVKSDDVKADLPDFFAKDLKAGSLAAQTLITQNYETACKMLEDMNFLF